MAYKFKIGDRSKHINIAYHLVCKNIKFRLISLLQVESGENLTNICTKLSSQVTLRKFRTAMMDAK
jgi:hypothetical protein